MNQKSAGFDPEKYEDHYEKVLADLINSKRAGKLITAKARPRAENVVDLTQSLRRVRDRAESLVVEARTKTSGTKSKCIAEPHPPAGLHSMSDISQ